MSDVKVIPDKIADAHAFLARAYNLCAKLSVTKSMNMKALALLYEVKNVSWKMHESEYEGWATTMDRRIRNILRAVAQGQLKSPTASWVKQLPWHSTLEGGEATAAKRPKVETAKYTARPTEMHYGFDEELMLAYRVPRGKTETKKNREMSLPVTVKPDTNLTSTVQATWLDGSVGEIPGLLYSVISDLQRSSGSHGSCLGVLWEGTHTANNNRVTIKQVVDHNLLLSLYEQGSHKCCLRLDYFGFEISDQHKQLPQDHPALTAGLKIMIKVAEEFCQNKIDRTELKRRKDGLLEEAGAGLSKAKAMHKAGTDKSKKGDGADMKNQGGTSSKKDEDPVEETQGTAKKNKKKNENPVEVGGKAKKRENEDPVKELEGKAKNADGDLEVAAKLHRAVQETMSTRARSSRMQVMIPSMLDILDAGTN
jgi:hypothetical protein